MELNQFLQEKWQAAGFDQPVAIQEKVFAAIEEGQNIVGIAPTGSGKTLAYLLPVLNQIEIGAPSQVLILTSSQELAMQVVSVAREWVAGSGLKVQALIGGANVKRQQDGLKKKPEILVGTPGRVFELISSKKIKANLIQTLIFDEVDQLLEGQNLNLIEKILKATDQQAQHLYFSATANQVVEKIQELETAVTVVDVSETDDSQGIVQHYYLKTSQRKKVDVLRHLLNMPAFWGIIFFNQVGELGSAEEKLSFHQLPVVSLASDQFKTQRQKALEQFKKHQVNGLLTTDVASRGLDIVALPMIVNHDVPMTKESYLHRAGRVGRMGAEGIVISLVSPYEMDDFKKINRQLQLKATEIFIHGGQLVDQLPEKLKTKPKKKIKKKK